MSFQNNHTSLVSPAPVGAVSARRAGWRDSHWLLLVEFGLVAAIFLADRHLPVSKTPYLLAVGWLSLWLRRVGWRGVGFSRYRSWPITLGLGAVVGVLMEAFELFVTQPLLVRLTGKQPNFSEFVKLEGNIKWALIGLALLWPLAAFGEEMVFRGYLMNRVADLGKRKRVAWIISLIAVNMLFGLAHRYQGITGIIDEGLMGVLLGLAYLGTGRNLSVPIVAHGMADTIDVVLIFLGHYPGM